MLNLLRTVIFAILVKPLVYILLGLNILEKENLPKKGPAILVSNHNSHLDTLVLMTLFDSRTMLKIVPVAAADYFLSNKLLAWISLKLFNILPIHRHVSKSNQEHFLQQVKQAIEADSLLIFYPEGSRGSPERLSKFKSGIAHVAQLYPQIPIIPIFMRGLGIALPKGSTLFVPTICDIVVGEPQFYEHSKEQFMSNLEDTFHAMRHKLESIGAEV